MGSHLREGDADRMLELVDEVRDDPEPGAAVPWSLLEGLQRLVPCDIHVAYQHHLVTEHPEVLIIQSQRGGGSRDLADHPDRDGPREADGFWTWFWSSFCSWPQRSGDLWSVVMTSDFHPDERDRLSTGVPDDLRDVRSSMIVSMPAEPGHVRRFTLFRQDSQSFTERDRQVMQLLRPHLHECWERAERSRRGVPHLTRREWEVLALVGSGLSAADIAAVLVISVATVRKHLEHIRERMDVSRVSTAAAIALPLAPRGSIALPRQVPRR